MSEPFGHLFIHTLLSWVAIMLYKLSLRLIFFLHPHTDLMIRCPSIIQDEQCCAKEKDLRPVKVREDDRLCKEDVEMALGRMGMWCSEQLQDYVGFDELAEMFVEEEPSLDEVKEAFYVFDEGRDGFIDAFKLQRALSNLGFGEGIALDACKEMITRYDENCDGQIDINEFVKLIERSFS